MSIKNEAYEILERLKEMNGATPKEMLGELTMRALFLMKAGMREMDLRREWQ